MKRLIISIVIVLSISIFFTFGCDKLAIETAIADFESAVNDNNITDFKAVLSSESDFYITETWGDFLNYFSDFDPVNYTNLDIDIDGSNSRVLSDGTYVGLAVDVKFRMRKDESDSTFFVPSWKVYQYYDYGAFTEPDDAVWQKLKVSSK